MHTSESQTDHVDRWAFANEVMDRAAKELDVVAVLTAIREFYLVGRIHRADVTECVIRAGELKSRALQSVLMAQAVKRKTAALPDTITARITASHRVSILDPWVKAQRVSLFGTTDLPFKSAKAAGEWLQAEAAKGPVAVATDGRLKTLAYRDWGLDDSVWIGAPDGPWFPSSPVQDAGDHERSGGQRRGGASVCVVAGSPVERLADATREMALASGFSQAQLVALVLCGTRPRLRSPRVVIQYRTHHPDLALGEHPTSQPLYTRRVVLETEDCDFLPDTVKRLYQRARRLLGSAKSKPFDDEDERLQRIVRKRGGLPAKPYALAFWEEVAAEYEAYTDTRKTPEALRTRYFRLQRALGEPIPRIRHRDKTRTPVAPFV
jgi:hypothetical protein